MKSKRTEQLARAVCSRQGTPDVRGLAHRQPVGLGVFLHPGDQLAGVEGAPE